MTDLYRGRKPERNIGKCKIINGDIKMSSELRSHLNSFTLKCDIVSILILLCHICSYMEYSPVVYSDIFDCATNWQTYNFLHKDLFLFSENYCWSRSAKVLFFLHVTIFSDIISLTTFAICKGTRNIAGTCSGFLEVAIDIHHFWQYLIIYIASTFVTFFKNRNF